MCLPHCHYQFPLLHFKMTVEGPDRGYSWVIVFCCAYIHFALFGLFRSWGVIYVAVISEYHVTREEASWPFSLCSAVFQLIGKMIPLEFLLRSYLFRVPRPQKNMGNRKNSGDWGWISVVKSQGNLSEKCKIFTKT